jgi:hypothetical protein
VLPVGDVTYVGNRVVGDGTSLIELERDEESGEVTRAIGIGETAELSDEELERLAPHFYLEKGGKIVEPQGAEAPVEEVAETTTKKSK